MFSEMDNRLGRMESQVNQLIRVGTVTTLYPDTGKVRVELKDADKLLSYELPVLYPKTSGDKYYWMPDVGEQVLCIFLPLGMEQGFVLGAFYSTADRPAEGNPDIHHIRFKDGTEIKYDRGQGLLTVRCVNRIEIEAAAQVRVRAARIEMN